MSSIDTVSSGFIGRRQAAAVPVVVQKSKPEAETSFSSKVTKLLVEFHIRRLLLDVEDNEKPLFRSTDIM